MQNDLSSCLTSESCLSSEISHYLVLQLTSDWTEEKFPWLGNWFLTGFVCMNWTNFELNL